MGIKEMKCPKCAKYLEVDSVRKFGNGRERTYWECKDCDLSIMFRDSKDGNGD